MKRILIKKIVPFMLFLVLLQLIVINYALIIEIHNQAIKNGSEYIYYFTREYGFIQSLIFVIIFDLVFIKLYREWKYLAKN